MDERNQRYCQTHNELPCMVSFSNSVDVNDLLFLFLSQEASTDTSLLEILITSLNRVLPPWTAPLLSMIPTPENRKLRKYQYVSRNMATGIIERASKDEDKADVKDVVGMLVGMFVSCSLAPPTWTCIL